ncbi:MAG TPA: flagellar basal body protein FliL [Methylothermaceae bacterium]|nr:flagellar basal body protein FliL [Methylothermaceae bacterium]
MAENEDLDLGEEKKSSKKLILIALVAVVLLLGGGGAAMYFLGVPPFAKSEVSAEDEEEAAAEEEKSSAPKTARFYEFSPFIVNFPRGGGARLLQLSFSVLAYDEETIEAVKKHEPMIRNNLLLLLGRYNPQDLRSTQGKEALQQAITGEIQKVLDRHADGGSIETVFFTQFVMQ